MHVRFRRLCLVVCLASTLAPTARADQSTWPVPRGPARTPAPVRYDPASLPDLPADFLDDAPLCVLYSGTAVRVEPDGTVESTTQELIRLNGRKGIDEFGEYRTITYAPAYE